MSNFRTIDRQTGFLLPPSVDEWLPEKHLARFVVEVIDGLDLRAMSGSYRGSGSASYHPRMLLGILVYGYATGVFSSRKLERATYDSVAFRFIAANDHPDHDTIAAFRRRFLKEIEGLMVQVLMIARALGVEHVLEGSVRRVGNRVLVNVLRRLGPALVVEREEVGPAGAVLQDPRRGRRPGTACRAGRRRAGRRVLPRAARARPVDSGRDVGRRRPGQYLTKEAIRLTHGCIISHSLNQLFNSRGRGVFFTRRQRRGD